MDLHEFLERRCIVKIKTNIKAGPQMIVKG